MHLSCRDKHSKLHTLHKAEGSYTLLHRSCGELCNFASELHTFVCMWATWRYTLFMWSSTLHCTYNTLQVQETAHFFWAVDVGTHFNFAMIIYTGSYKLLYGGYKGDTHFRIRSTEQLPPLGMGEYGHSFVCQVQGATHVCMWDYTLSHWGTRTRSYILQRSHRELQTFCGVLWDTHTAAHV